MLGPTTGLTQHGDDVLERRAHLAGEVPPEIIAEVDRHFEYDQRVELTVTAAFYSMVPRILDALGVPIEGTEPAKHGRTEPPAQVGERDGHPSPVGSGSG